MRVWMVMEVEEPSMRNVFHVFLLFGLVEIVRELFLIYTLVFK